MISFVRKYFGWLVSLLLIFLASISIFVRFEMSIQTQHTELNTSSISLIDSTSFDFGVIPRDRKVEHIFSLQNPDSTPLEIKKIVTSCGCTTAEPFIDEKKQTMPFTLASGSTSQIRVIFDPLAHDSRGDTYRAVRIETNHPQNPFIVINLHAYVQ